MFDTYLVYASDTGIVIVDQHSAHERVLYEEVLKQLAGDRGSAQHLLIPVTIELTDEELDAVESYRDVLDQIGFEAVPFGGRTVALNAVPNPHPKFDAARCFREMVADLARGRFGGWHNRLERFAATYACRAAVMAGDKLSEREIRELLLRLFATTVAAARCAWTVDDRAAAGGGARTAVREEELKQREEELKQREEPTA